MYIDPTLEFPTQRVLQYLELPDTYTPSPKDTPLKFMLVHIRQLPPHLLVYFGYITTPKERTTLPVVRNRRLKFVESKPDSLSFNEARSTWPMLWQGPQQNSERRGEAGGNDEMAWVTRGFLNGNKQHVGGLGKLLGEYEEERKAERVRKLRRAKPTSDEFIPEEESDIEEEDAAVETETVEEAKIAFERLVREKFIYGLLDSIDYEVVDWDERLDEDDDREAEDRYFDED